MNLAEVGFEQIVQQWILDNPSLPRRAWRATVGVYHNKIPREFRPYSILHWVTKTSVASSAPAIAFLYGSIAAWTAALAASLIFAGHSAVSLFDRLSKEKSAGGGDTQSEILVRFGDLLTALKASSTAALDRDDAVRACLGILEIFARQTTKSRKGEVSVSLVLYAGSSTSKMRIRHRNPGNDRPINREFDCDSLVGHRACQSGTFPRVVHDIRKFGRAGSSSPTQSSVDYRSIFIIPVESRRTNGNGVSGFLSIDCRRPYAFYGNRANVIIVTCEPVISRIRDLI